VPPADEDDAVPEDEELVLDDDELEDDDELVPNDVPVPDDDDPPVPVPAGVPAGAKVIVNGAWNPVGSSTGAWSTETWSPVGAPRSTVVRPVAVTVWLAPGATVPAKMVFPDVSTIWTQHEPLDDVKVIA
jgi:hypothetical protein